MHTVVYQKNTLRQNQQKQNRNRNPYVLVSFFLFSWLDSEKRG